MRRILAAPLLAALLMFPAAFAAEGGGPAPCVEGLEARAEGDGGVTLRWEPAPGATAHLVHRTEVDRPWAVATFRVPAPESTFHDGTALAGVTYRYVVVPEPEPAGAACAGVETTAIPYLRGLGTALRVAAVAAAGYVLVAGTRRAPFPSGQARRRAGRGKSA